ncbi:MAG: alpha/beta fold hydrolase [Flavobacteriales bacterium]|nr:MAG: alpha/beta fold hydrolase [Flavobacteriales bacterium]
MKLFSRIYGEGKPLIILHGLFGMSDNWNTLGKQWSDKLGRSVHIIDQRNHGRSPWSNPHDYHALSDDLAEYFQEKNIDTASILGHSMGGKTAMFFATLFPEKVDKLLVADIAPRSYPVHHREIIDALQYVYEKSPHSRVEAQDALGEKIRNEGIRFFLLKSLHRNENGIYTWRFNLQQIDADIEKIGAGLPPPALYDGPAVFIRGLQSDYINDDDFSSIHSHFPQAIVESVENAGHWLHAEQPKIFSNIVEKHLSN